MNNKYDTGKICAIKATGELVRVLCEFDGNRLSVARIVPVGSFSGVFTVPRSGVSELYEKLPMYEDLKELVGKAVEGWSFSQCGLVTGARINDNGDEQLKIVGLGWVNVNECAHFNVIGSSSKLAKTMYKNINNEDTELTEEQYALLQR